MKSMNKMSGEEVMDVGKCFFGTATVGERGQIVIPAEARAELEMAPGEKVLIMRHPVHRGLMIFKLEAVREFLDEFQRGLDAIEQQPTMENQ